VCEILKLHDSRLEIRSQRGVGSTFAFRLPLRRDLEIEPAPPPSGPVAYQPFPPRVAV